MSDRRHRARAIVFPVNVTLLAQASVVGEGLMGVNIFEPLAPEGEKFPGILETMAPEEFPRTLEAYGNKRPIFYRADMRPDIDSFIPTEFYEDGAYHQLRKQKKAKGEIAFADSLGGAVYGAVQFRHHGVEDTVPEDFLDDHVEYYLHIYTTDRPYDYTPEGSQMDSMLGVETDFFITGEVRYFDDVPVEYLGKIPVTKREIAILSTLIYKGKTVADFDFELEGPEEYEEGIKRVLAGDKAFIKKHALPWPGKEIPMHGEYAEGINTDIALQMVDHFNRKWEKLNPVRDMKSRGMGRGWHYDSARHSLAARGMRTR